MGVDPARNALNAIVDALQPLTSPDRKRAVLGALHFLQEDWVPLPHKRGTEQAEGVAETPEANGACPPSAQAWMKKNDLSAEEVEQVFSFAEDGTINVIADLPGKGKREKTIMLYTLMGVGTFLRTGEKKFEDERARAACAHHSAYDAPNHAATMREMTNELTGDKKSGWGITAPGLKKGAKIVKELAAGTE